MATAGVDGTVRIWDVWEGKQRGTLAGHQSGVNALDISPDGTWLATVNGDDHTVRIWELHSGRPLAIMSTESPIRTCQCTPDGRSIVVGGQAGLYVFDVVLGTDNRLS